MNGAVAEAPPAATPWMQPVTEPSAWTGTDLERDRSWFHGRAGHEPVAEEHRKRLLLRVWIDLPEVRPFADEGRVRYGVIRHGKLGWTAADLLAGNHHTPHRRRADGVPVVG